MNELVTCAIMLDLLILARVQFVVMHGITESAESGTEVFVW